MESSGQGAEVASEGLGVSSLRDIEQDSEGLGVSSLRALKGKKWTLCHGTSLLINCALLVVSHVGVNAVVWATLDVSQGSGGGGSDENNGTESLTGRCNANDVEIWQGPSVFQNTTNRCITWDQVKDSRNCPYANEGHLDHVYSDVLYAMGKKQFGGGSAADTQSRIQSEWGLSLECSSCLVDAIQCTIGKCALQCIPRLNSEGCPSAQAAECVPCIKDNCKVEECTGFEDNKQPLNAFCQGVGGGAADLPTEDLCQPKLEWFNVFQLTFGNAISKSIDGGAYILAVVVLLASGVWPYTKNLLMAYVWFSKMSPERRDQILLWLARLGRWSLVDVYAVIVIIVGLRISKKLPGDQILITDVTPSYAIYCFAIAAIWALVQGEVIRYQSRRDMVKKPLTMSADKKQTLVVVFGLLTLLALCGVLFGLYMPVARFQLSGVLADFAGSNKLEYTGFDFAWKLLSNCIQGLSSYETIFMSSIFLATAVAAPVFTLVGFLFFCVIPSGCMISYRGWVRSFFIIGNFACLDVFLVSLLILIAQFKPLIRGSLGSQVASFCPESVSNVDDCVAYEGSLQGGAFLIAAATVCMWGAQICATKVAQVYRLPKEDLAKLKNGELPFIDDDFK